MCFFGDAGDEVISRAILAHPKSLLCCFNARLSVSMSLADAFGQSSVHIQILVLDEEQTSMKNV